MYGRVNELLMLNDWTIIKFLIDLIKEGLGRGPVNLQSLVVNSIESDTLPYSQKAMHATNVCNFGTDNTHAKGLITSISRTT